MRLSFFFFFPPIPHPRTSPAHTPLLVWMDAWMDDCSSRYEWMGRQSGTLPALFTLPFQIFVMQIPTKNPSYASWGEKKVHRAWASTESIFVSVSLREITLMFTKRVRSSAGSPRTWRQWMF